MKLYTKTIIILVLLILLSNVSIYANTKLIKYDKDSIWELKLEIKVNGNFESNTKLGIKGTYHYDIVLNGSIGLDEDNDFMYYYKKEDIKSFEIKFYNPKNGKNHIFNKSILSQHIEFIIRKGRYVYLEFISEKLDISKIDKELKIKINLPISYGILNRKSNRKYRKGINEGTNKILWDEKFLYSKLNFKKKYNWVWTKKSKNIIQSHSVDVNLFIKIK